MIRPRQVSSSQFSDEDGRDEDARGSCGRVLSKVFPLCAFSPWIWAQSAWTPGASCWAWMQGRWSGTGPRCCLSVREQRGEYIDSRHNRCSCVCVSVCMCERLNNRMQRGNTPCIFLPVKARISPEFHFFSFWCYETVRPANQRLATMNKSCESFSGTL